MNDSHLPLEIKLEIFRAVQQALIKCDEHYPYDPRRPTWSQLRINACERELADFLHEFQYHPDFGFVSPII